MCSVVCMLFYVPKTGLRHEQRMANCIRHSAVHIFYSD